LSLESMLPTEKLFERAREDAPAGSGKLALFSGTLPVIGEGLVYASRYVLSLKDPVLGREIRHEYAVRILPDRN